MNNGKKIRLVTEHQRFLVTNGWSVAESIAETAYPSGKPEYKPGFSGVFVTQSSVFCVVFVDHYGAFLFFPLVVVLSVLLR